MEGWRGALPLDLRWVQQRVPSGSLSDHSKDGGRQAAGAWRPCGETGLFVPWEGLRPMAGRGLWTPYLPAFCQSISLKVRELLSRHLVSPGWGPTAWPFLTPLPNLPCPQGVWKEKKVQNSSRRNFSPHKGRPPSIQISTGTTAFFLFTFFKKRLGLLAITWHLGIKMETFSGLHHKSLGR